MSCKQNLKLDVDIKTIQKILVDYGGGVFDIASRWGYDTITAYRLGLFTWTTTAMNTLCH